MPSSKTVNAVIGGWQLGALATLQTGVPYNESYDDNNASTNTIVGGTFPTRPNYVPGQPFFIPNQTAGANGQWVNLAAWQEPAGVHRTYEPQHALRPWLPTIRHVPRQELQHALQRAPPVANPLDAFNAFNHTNFANPNTYWKSSSGGKITSSALSPRELQLGARYTF